MQGDHEKYDHLLTAVDENFTKMIEKLYTRENATSATEVKETYFSSNKQRPNNLTYELNQIFTNLEKLIIFVEKEKSGLLLKKENSGMEHEDLGPRPDPLTDQEFETLSKILRSRISEQEEYISEMKALVNNLNSLTNIYQL